LSAIDISYEVNMTATPNPQAAILRRMGRKKRWAEDMQARFPEGTFKRIAAVLEEGEDRTDFVREAVEREVARREKAREKKGRRPSNV
jgi:hypothetical protein